MKPLACLAASLALVSCATIAPPAPSGTVDDRLNRLIVPGIQFLDTGVPLPSDRPVVDDSFDIGLTMRFESAAALRAYETNPLHVKKVTEVLRPLSRKLQVYDIQR